MGPLAYFRNILAQKKFFLENLLLQLLSFLFLHQSSKFQKKLINIFPEKLVADVRSYIRTDRQAFH